MHSYYAENKEKFKKGLNQFMKLVKPELEKTGGYLYPSLFLHWVDFFASFVPG